jgi:hypothetical protein
MDVAMKCAEQGWFKFVADCNNDGGYAHSYGAALTRSELETTWRSECPGLEVPSVLWSSASGKYELTGLNVPKQQAANT